jgi:hypothetical protein
MQSFEKCLPRAARAAITGLRVLVTICFAGSFAVAGRTTVTSAGGGNGAITGGVDRTDAINRDTPISTHRAITLPGVTASQVRWNFTRTGTVFSTARGNVLDGAFLATNPGQRIQFSSLHLTGAVINTVGHIPFVSNSRMTFGPFMVPRRPEVIPEPRSLLLFGTGLVAGAGLLRRKARAGLRPSAGKVIGVEPMPVRELTPSGANRSE